MDKKDVIQLGKEAGIIPIQNFSMTNLDNFAALIENKLHQTYEERLHAVEAIQREKVVRWMMQHGYATGHGDSIEELLFELKWQINERISILAAAEREACAALCDKIADEDGFEGGYADRCAHAIRERNPL